MRAVFFAVGIVVGIGLSIVTRRCVESYVSHWDGIGILPEECDEVNSK